MWMSLISYSDLKAANSPMCSPKSGSQMGGGWSPGALNFSPWSLETHCFVAWSPALHRVQSPDFWGVQSPGARIFWAWSPKPFWDPTKWILTRDHYPRVQLPFPSEEKHDLSRFFLRGGGGCIHRLMIICPQHNDSFWSQSNTHELHEANGI